MSHLIKIECNYFAYEIEIKGKTNDLVLIKRLHFIFVLAKKCHVTPY